MKTFSLRTASPSFALISVLALVSLAALSATAFLASARLERLASRPLADITRLEMASSSALAMAMSILVQAGDAGTYRLQRVVTYWRTNEADDLGYLLVGSPVSPLMMVYLPAFSTASMSNALEPTNLTTHAIDVTGQGNFRTTISNRFASQWTNGLNATNSVNLLLLGNQTSPPVAWIPIRQERRIRPGSAATTNVQVARMAFYVQDLQGLIDAERMGGSNNRTTGTNPAEISLTNLTGTALVTNASNFVSATNRRLYASVGMLRSTGGLATNDLRYVATGLRSWGWVSNNADAFSNRIPPGIQVAAGRGYADAGRVKTDLNALVTNSSAGVTDLTNLFANNLPNFGTRGGAMTTANYLANLAANMVDFADIDTLPTYDTGSMPPAWRGTEAIPWPNEVFTRFNLQSRTNAGANFEFKLGVQQSVEVWNLSSKEVSLPSGSLAISNNLNIQLQCSNWFGNLATVDSANPPILETTTNASITLPPNSYAVLSANPRIFTINVPTNLVPGTNPPTLTINRTQPSPNTNNRYVAFFSNVPVDASRGGRLLGITTNMRVNDFHFICSAVGFGTSQTTNNYNLAGGDPRAQLFVSQPTMAITYNFSTPGGRNQYSGADGGAKIVDPRVNWPDGGHSLGNSGGDVVTSPSSANANNTLPQGLQRQGNINHWVQKSPDSGAFTNLADLGNIFDPIQWGDPNNPFHPRDSAAWMTLSASCTNFSGAGGRNTLRIGRPEHPRFAFTNFGGDTVPNMGMSAVALLDLLQISVGASGPTDPNRLTNAFAGGGKINLNTAPRPVLAALAGGVALTNDPAITGSPNSTNMIQAFTQGVARFRQLYPFYSPAQLSFISTDYGVGAWTNTWTNTAVFATNAGGGLAGVTAWNDAGREEWFSRIYGLSGVDSLNFRCYVVAQLTDASGNPRGAPYRKYYQIYTTPYPQTPAFSAVVVEEGSY